MIDKRTRTIVASGVFDRSTKGIDLTVLLARALAPRRVRRTANRLQHLNLPVMPWAKDLTDEDRVDYDDRVPFIYPQRLIMDNGADWRSKVFMSGCARFGIDVTIGLPAHQHGKRSSSTSSPSRCSCSLNGFRASSPATLPTADGRNGRWNRC